MRMNDRRRSYFIEVMKHSSIREAAYHLNTAASVITRQLDRLEEEIGAALFHRRSYGIIPTEAAHRLLDYYRTCQIAAERFQEDLQGELHGTVHVAMTEGYVTPLAAKVIPAFSAAHPGVDLQLFVLTANSVISEIQGERAHIGLSYNPPDLPDLQICASASRPVMLCVSPHHPLASLTSPISLRDVLPHRFAIMPEPYGLGQLIQAVALSEGVRLAPFLTTNSVAITKAFALSGTGCAFLPRTAITEEANSGKLVALPLANPLFEQAQMKILIKENRPLPRAAQAFLEFIKERAGIFADASRAPA